MPFDLKKIQEDSISLYAQMQNDSYTFMDLQQISQLKEAELCLVLIQLIREDKIKQIAKGKNICYRKITIKKNDCIGKREAHR